MEIGQSPVKLLAFSLINSTKSYGLNFFKVKNIIDCPNLPSGNDSSEIISIIDIYNKRVPVINISYLLYKQEGQKHNGRVDKANSKVLIFEYNNYYQAILIPKDNTILDLTWEDINFPSKEELVDNHYLAATAQLNNKKINIIDIDKIINDSLQWLQ